MEWHEIVITTTHEASDAVCDLLETLNSCGVVIEDPYDIINEIKKPNTLDYADDDFLDSLGEDVKIKAYFDGNLNEKELIVKIQEKLEAISGFLDLGKKEVSYNSVKQEDWSTLWRKNYKPIRISKRVVIKPSWEEYKKEPSDVVVELEPGLAFGTGQHETTKLCSEFLEKYINPNDKVLDVGCGTGILSIISKKLGASKVLAVDIDPMCVKVAKENCCKNGETIDVICGVLEDVCDSNFDIIVANIIADVIIDFSPILGGVIKNEGFFIASGIIKEREQEVRVALQNCNFSMVERKSDGDWVAMVFKYA